MASISLVWHFLHEKICTLYDYKLKLGRFIEDRPIDEVSSNDIRLYLGYVKNEYGLSLSTVERYKVALQAFYRWMFDEGSRRFKQQMSFNKTISSKYNKSELKLYTIW